MSFGTSEKIRRTDRNRIYQSLEAQSGQRRNQIQDQPSPFPLWSGYLPAITGKLEASLILPVPLNPYAALEPEETLRYLESLRKLMGKLFPRRHEILLVPFGQRRPALGFLLSQLTLFTKGKKNFRWVGGFHEGPGSAVREAVFMSHGRKILVGSLEYLYDPSFFRTALNRLRPGMAGVRANRRLPDSEFIVPTTVLPMVYRRHLLGLAISRIWSRLFSLHLTDFLSGAYVLQRSFALSALSRITCPGFLYETELEILAQTHGLALADIPASFFLGREKNRVRVWGEILSVIAWSWRFLFRTRGGEYGPLKKIGTYLSADDWGLSRGINDGILELAQLGLLRRVSVLAGSRHLNYRLSELKKIKGVEFGLHFNLTQSESGGHFKSPIRFLRAWWARRGRDGKMVRLVREALSSQISNLRMHGVRPVRLDGHHHVHSVPGLLGIISDILIRERIRNIRVPYHPSLWFGFKAPIAWMGRKLRQTARRLNFGFLPFYYPSPGDFSSLNRLVRILNRFADSEILIHPAKRNDIAQAAPSDSYRRERVREFELLRMLALSDKTPTAKAKGDGSRIPPPSAT